jgi:methionine-rich copper-binding protein CopC
MKPGSRLIWAMAVAGAIGASMGVASAHAFPKSENPAVGATLAAAPTEVVIDFDNPIEQMFARLQVVDSAGADVTNGPPSVTGDRRRLSVALKSLKPAEYTVKWSVVSEDSHRSEGSYTFTVAGGSS